MKGIDHLVYEIDLVSITNLPVSVGDGRFIEFSGFFCRESFYRFWIFLGVFE